MTPRTSGRPTDGALTARWARALGRPLQPWQRAVADVTGERDPYTGRLVYSRVVLLAPRRAGKSLLMLATALGVCTRPRARAFYTSAHRENAARMWRDDWFAQIGDRPALARFATITRGNGTEAVALAGGGTFRLVAPTGAAIRGAATNLVIIDEARELGPDVGDDLEAAAFPTLATGAGGQAWIVSSAGDATAAWLARWRDLGRAAVAADRRTGLCFVEYAAPDDADPDDEATWLAHHPGLASGNVLLEAVRADHETMSPDVFAAEYLGRWPETLVDARLVDAWQTCTDPAATLGAAVVFAVEVDEDRTTAVIVAAADAGDGRIAVEVIEHRPLGRWVGPRLVELTERHSPVAVVWDAAGPAASLAPDLVDVATRLVPVAGRDVAAAAGWFHDTVLGDGFRHRPDPILDAAVVAARRRRAGGAWLWDRRQPDALALLAATLAGWVHRDGRHRPPQFA